MTAPHRARSTALGALAMGLLVGCAGATPGDAEAPLDTASAVVTSTATDKSAPIATKLCRADSMRECERACSDGGVLSCVRWGHMLRAGLKRLSSEYGSSDDRIPVAPSIARRLYASACDAGYGEACRLAGDMLVAGEGGEADPTRAASLFERACSANSAEGCFESGRIALESKDQDRAIDQLGRACDGGDAQGCSLLGDLGRELERAGGDIPPRRPPRRGGADRKSGVACPGGTSLRREITTAHGYQSMARPRIFCVRPDESSTKHGPFAEWASLEDEAASNGVLSARGEYRDDQRVGTWEERDMRGDVRATGRYIDGEKEGLWTERSGAREETITYSHGRPHGPYAKVDHDSEEREDGVYDNGKKTGVWKRTRRGGAVEERTYVDGREIPKD